MPLKKIPLNPGFNKQSTASQAEGQWIDGDMVRFRYGSPEKIGDWHAQTFLHYVDKNGLNKELYLDKRLTLGQQK